jgi:microcystin-dependent protein
MPLAQGGVPPKREDFNGILYTLSSYAMFQQAGGKFTYDARVDYTPPAIIFYGSDLWWCVQANGASSLVVTPGTNSSYWIKLKDYLANPLAAYPVGSYYMSSNSTSPATLFGGTWTQITNRFIFAAGSGYSVNSTGGSVNKTLSTDNIPSHSHSCGSAGSHTHTRGSMNITGWFDGEDAEYVSGGAFYMSTRPSTHNLKDSGGESNTQVNFDASRSWTGATSSNGSHSHTIGSTGKGTAFNVMPPYIVAYVWRRTA